MDFSVIKSNLEKLGYKVSCFNTSNDAVDYLKDEISGKSVGIGGSATVLEMGLYEALRENNKVHWHWFPEEGVSADETRALAANTEVYISSVNGIAQSGEIINIDGTCNRVASIMYGHEKVVFVVGANKIEENFDKAMYRARNVASPLNAQRLNRNTPCAKNADKCYDCKSPERICRGASILWCKPNSCDYEIILIDEKLGY